MATKNRIFVCFAIEDANYRTMLVGQARHEDSPFEFIDMSVKEPWDEKWKTQCRSRIKGCDGVIALISKKTKNAEGAPLGDELCYRGRSAHHRRVCEQERQG